MEHVDESGEAAGCVVVGAMGVTGRIVYEGPVCGGVNVGEGMRGCCASRGDAGLSMAHWPQRVSCSSSGPAQIWS